MISSADEQNKANAKEEINNCSSTSDDELEIAKADNDEQTVLAVTADGRYYVDQVETSETEMLNSINSALERKLERIILIKADQEAQYSNVMNVLDRLQRAGIEDVGECPSLGWLEGPVCSSAFPVDGCSGLGWSNGRSRVGCPPRNPLANQRDFRLGQYSVGWHGQIFVDVLDSPHQSALFRLAGDDGGTRVPALLPTGPRVESESTFDALALGRVAGKASFDKQRSNP